jgi:hypothetical protein
MNNEMKQKAWEREYNRLFNDIKNDKLTHKQALSRQDQLYSMDTGDAMYNPYDLENLIKCKYVTGEDWKPLFPSKK